jgi:hypothetical protein
MDIDFSKKDEGLSRKLWKGAKQLGLKVGSKWGYVFSGYYRSLKPREQIDFRYLVSRFPRACETCFIAYLKQLSINAMSMLLEYKYMWLIYFLDMHVLGGFDTDINRQNPFEAYPEDFGVVRAPDVPERIQFWIKDTIDRIGIGHIGYSLEDFVSFRDAYALPGASVQGTAKKVSFTDDAGRKASLKVKNKWFALSHLSDSDICGKLSTTYAEVKPFIKQDEPAACRTVQCYDTWSLIRCSYLEQSLLDYNSHGFWTTIGLKLEEKERFRKSIHTKDLNWVCTDQSKFDIHQPKSWILYAVEYLFSKILIINPEAKECIDWELDSLRSVFINYEGRTLQWRNGILSGYKFTALLDSILNRAESRYVCERLSIKPIFEVYQGDDATMGFSKPVNVVALADEYSKIGLVVNPSKTWHSTGITEYLHEIYYKGMVLGFPARSFKAVAWSSPITGSGGTFGSAKTRALLSTFLMCQRRGLNVLPMVWRFMKTLGLKDEVKFQAWVRTPVYFGGFGMGDDGRMKLDIRTWREKKYRTYIQGIQGGRLYVAAARLRIESACPLPGIRNEYRFVKVKGSSRIPMLRARRLADIGVVRTDWEARDLRTYKDAYERKLLLEWKLRYADKVLESDLPAGFLGLVDVDKAYRRYRKLVNMVLSVETDCSSAEGYCRISGWANMVWAGIAMEWSLNRLDGWNQFHSKLCRTLHSLILSRSFQKQLQLIRV